MAKSKKPQTPQETLITVKDEKGVLDLIEYVSGFEYVAYDTETTGVHRDCEVVGLSVSCEAGVGIYVVLAYWDVEKKQLISLGLIEVVKKLLALLLTKKLVMHNAPFDCQVTNRNFGIELMPALHTDTMALAHLLDENRRVGLKELGAFEFGLSAKREYEEMKASVIRNGGIWEDKKKDATREMFKADMDLLARYGAKDTILTLSLFYLYVPRLFEQGLDKFFYEEETMPLMKGPTYDMNTAGLRVDSDKLKKLQEDLEREILELKASVYESVYPYVKERFPGTKKKDTFNINSKEQLAWLLFIRLGYEFRKLTDTGRKVAKEHCERIPYKPTAKKQFIAKCLELKLKPEKYIKCDKATMTNLVRKQAWISKLLEYRRLKKLLETYVVGIQRRMQYGVINPSFLQHGTTSGRYSSRNPNFQNLPKNDKRIKACIVARPGKVFIGADYSQLEPRVFASFAQDVRLLNCFKLGQDFYSVVGVPIFKKYECSVFKKDENSFEKKFPYLRDNSKVVALSTPYGTTANRMSENLRDAAGDMLSIEECQSIIDDYFEAYPQVHQLMLNSHEEAKANGVVYNLFGRPRRIPQAKLIKRMFGNTPFHELPYEWRTLLNLSMNHRIQSTAASIVNRAAVACKKRLQEKNIDAKIVLQVHDELVLEALAEQAEEAKMILKECMEQTSKLPGVDLIAEPKIASNLADLK